MTFLGLSKRCGMPVLEKVFLDRFARLMPDSDTVERKLINHIRREFFPIVYQTLDKWLKQRRAQLGADGFKCLLSTKHLLKLIDNVYSTRVSHRLLDRISARLARLPNLDDYERSIEIFSARNAWKNSFSLGTKVLHIHNPDENPILDAVVRRALGVYNRPFNIELCIAFKEAANRYCCDNSDCFKLNRRPLLGSEFAKYGLEIDFPRMKILDMVLYQR